MKSNAKSWLFILVAFAISCYEGIGQDAEFQVCPSVYDACVKIKGEDVSQMACGLSAVFGAGEEGCESPEKPKCFCKTDSCNKIIETTTTVTTTANQTVTEEATRQGKDNDVDDNENRTEVITPGGSSNAAISDNQVNCDSTPP